jgi:hypothetical protein
MELSEEEERHLYNLSIIPAAIVTYVLLICFFYFGRKTQSLSLFYYLTHFGIPFMIAIPLTIFLSFEILYSRKTHSFANGQLKRFFGRMSLLLLGVFVLLSALGITFFVLSNSIDQWNLLLLSAILWFVIWTPLMLRFKGVFKRLSSGRW